MFLVNSRHPLVCAPRPWLPRDGAPFSRSYGGNLPSSFNTVLSSASVCSTSPPVSVSGTVCNAGAVSWKSPRPPQSDKGRHDFQPSSRPGRLGNINPIPIGYGSRPRLRGRLTLRGLTLRRNPWTFGERVSHPRCTLLMSAFALPIPPACLTARLHRPTERSATASAASCSRTPAASVRGFSPVTFSAQDNLSRPVSYYAFFKGWLLLSQPPGCLGRPTSFPT